jgi:type I restriction enzyme S subunit
MTVTVLPTDWMRVRIGDVATVSRGASPRPIASPRWFSDTSEVGWVRISDLGRSDGLTLKTTTQRLSPDGVARSRLLPVGTLIMSIAATVGVPIVTGISACIHDGFVALEGLEGVDRTYLLYVLKSLEGELRSAGQTGSQSNVNTDIVNGLKVNLPPEPEQKRIATTLNDSDDLIGSLERLIAKKQAIKQGVVQGLLTGNTRLAGFEGDWPPRSVSALGTVLKGRGIKRDDVRATGVACIRYGELYTRYSGYVERPASHVEENVALAALPIYSGDLLFAGSGETAAEIGTCVAYIGKQRAVAGGDIIVLRTRGHDPVFLSSLMNMPRVAKQKSRLGQGDAVVHISGRALSSIEVRVPELREQEAIARVIMDMDAEIDTLRERLVKTEDIKQGMMQELLTGRIRLSVAEATA